MQKVTTCTVLSIDYVRVINCFMMIMVLNGSVMADLISRRQMIFCTTYIPITMLSSAFSAAETPYSTDWSTGQKRHTGMSLGAAAIMGRNLGKLKSTKTSTI